MRTTKTILRSLATLAAASLLLSACDSKSEPEAEKGFSMQIANPAKPLVPGNTTETSGGAIVDSLFTGLVTYSAENNKLEYGGVAEENGITTSDNGKTFTITLKKGWTFHDGTPVTADSFIKAWNYTALGKNGFVGASFFSNIEGYKDLNPPVEAGKPLPEPLSDKLSGLTKVDDHTFTVALTNPFTQFPLTLGYTVFAPLPEAFYKNPEEFGRKPIGNGPWQAENEFVQHAGIKLVPFEGYPGEKPKTAGLEFRVFAEEKSAYSSVEGGELDISAVPSEMLSTVAETFGDRYVTRDSSAVTYLVFPTYNEKYNNKELRQAISLAIDRPGTTKAIFNNTFTPATSLVSPVVDGHRDNACKYCTQDVAAAQQKLAASNWDSNEPMELWFNGGFGHDRWMKAISNQLNQNLGVKTTLKGDLQWAQYVPKLNELNMSGPFRYSWLMDYPSMQNYLEPLYATSSQPPGGANFSKYSNQTFDELLLKGNNARSSEEAITFYQQAEDVALEDLPAIPLFVGSSSLVHSTKIANVTVDGFGRVVTTKVTTT